MIEIWAIYERPKDFPDHYVARMFIGEQPTNNIVMSKDLGVVRQTMIDMGLVRLPPSEGDDAKIVETWL